MKPFLIRKHIVEVFIFLFILTLIGSFAIRGMVLRKAITIVNAKLRNHQYVAHWDGARFSGLRTVFVKEIYIQSRSGQDEAYIDSVSLQMRIMPLFFKHVKIRKLDCKAISIRFNSNDSIFRSKVVVPLDSTSLFERIKGRDMADFVNKNIRRFFSYVPASMHIGSMEARLMYAGNITLIGLRDFRLEKGRMSASLNLPGNKALVKILLDGRLDKATSVIEVNLANADSNLLQVPVLQDKYGIAAGFDSLTFLMDFANRNRHMVNVKGIFSFRGFELNGQRLSSDNIKIDQFRSSFRLNIGPDFIEIDSTTKAYLNQIMLAPFLKVSLAEEPEIDFKILPVQWRGEDFFNSLPRGMFTSLTGMKAEGLLNFFLTFRVNPDKPDSLFFNTQLTGDHFNIKAFGTDDYRMLNGSFIYRAYERGKQVTAFLVGPENPNFVPFEQISPFLRASVMTSEDGSFFYHNGFNPNAFRESIVANIKERRFARGGSTITMQLVKNVFLRRNKTLARKIEEAIIVWLIENKDLVSKRRMYEVYLNIIEWGPGIYGINQASHFYFNKSPADLSLQESVYLASIVPRPKLYRYTFETNGNPRAFYENYFNRLKELMVRKEFIPATDTIGIRPTVLLIGPAASVFVAKDTIPIDSIKVDDLIFLPEL